MTITKLWKSRSPIGLRLACVLSAFIVGSAQNHVVLAQAEAEAPAADAVEAAEPADDPPPDAKQYDTLPVDENLKRSYLSVNQMLMAGKFAPGQEADFDKYYQQYFLARWTDPKYLTKLPDFRKELRNSHLGKKSAAAQVHDHLTALMLGFMKTLIDGSYHPAVKINAMLMIGELNSVESPQTAMPEALAYLMTALEDADLPDALRAAALVGIQRHVSLGISDQDARRKLTSVLLKIASAELPAGMERPAREWILGQAIETFGGLGAVGEGNAVFKAIAATLSDNKLKLSTRGIAAQALGRLNYTGAAGINPLDTGKALAQFLADVCTDSLDKAKQSDSPISRRRMQQYLLDVLTALDGDGGENHKGIISLATAANQKTFIETLQKHVDNTAEKVGKASDGDDLTDPVDQLLGNLEEMLK